MELMAGVRQPPCQFRAENYPWQTQGFARCVPMVPVARPAKAAGIKQFAGCYCVTVAIDTARAFFYFPVTPYRNTYDTASRTALYFGWLGLASWR